MRELHILHLICNFVLAGTCRRRIRCRIRCLIRRGIKRWIGCGIRCAIGCGNRCGINLAINSLSSTLCRSLKRGLVGSASRTGMSFFWFTYRCSPLINWQILLGVYSLPSHFRSSFTHVHSHRHKSSGQSATKRPSGPFLLR